MENEINVEQQLRQAVTCLIEGSMCFSSAGFIKTSEQLLKFTLNKEQKIKRIFKMENEMNVEQKMMQAVKHLIESAKYFSSAGFIKTSKQLLNFTLDVATQIEAEESKLEEFKNKLSNDEFDNILSNILSIEIK